MKGMRYVLGAVGRSQGVGSGSLYVALSFAVSGVLTYVFQSLSARALGPVGYGGLAVLWSTTFLTVQVLWIGVAQTLGRHVAEREARGEDPRPVVRSVRRLQLAILVAFLVVSVPLIPLLASALFDGNTFLAAAFVAAVAAYAAEYSRRGTFGGRRQFARLGALHVAESSSRTIIGAALLVAGAGVAGSAVAIVLAPIVGVLAVRPTKPGAVLSGEGGPFGAWRAFRFAGPVLVCVACAQALANGGPILVASLSGGSGGREGAGVLLAALILTRAPQYVMSPAIAALLPHASRTLQVDGTRGLDRLVARAVGVVGAVGIFMVAAVWLLGELGMTLLYGPGFETGRGTLVALAALAASSLVCEVLDQALFARSDTRLAALAWISGLLVAVVFALVSSGGGGEIVFGISLSLALGAGSSAAAHAVLYALLAARSRVSKPS